MPMPDVDSGLALKSPGTPYHFQLPITCVGVESGMFAALAAEPRIIFTIAELSKRTGIDPRLCGKRMLRYYQSLAVVSQPEEDGFKATNIARALGNPTYGTTIRFFQRIIAPRLLQLPDFLQKHGYTDPNGITFTAWNIGHQTDQSPLQWSSERPWREGRPSFFDVFDFEKRIGQDTTSFTPLFVNIGGAMGAQCITFRQRYPRLPGRASPLPAFKSVEAEAYDFFTPEAVQVVLYDWPIAKCVEILFNIKSAMTEESVILIDESFLSEKGVRWKAT
ncbi:S-adenosyl-L-methionine-dependent methyltransferase [Xylariaceae sp. FL0804]|nr:S-adenosyl-L-methionine-dependent methyltransferase [Xylariaceae sp. FL0804]